KADEAGLYYLKKKLRTEVPFVSAPAFAYNTFGTFRKKPNYYDFLDIATETDFQKLTGVRDQQDRLFAGEYLEAMGKSEVVKVRVRGLQLQYKIKGAYLRTNDPAYGTV